MLTPVIKIPRNIEFIYHGDSIEYVKDNDPLKPLTPSEKLLCDEVVKEITRIAKAKKGD
jgi:hypothetical protein